MLVGAIILVRLGEMKDALLRKGLKSELLWSEERMKNWKEKEAINRISKDEEKNAESLFLLLLSVKRIGSEWRNG